jgi:uncharacterized protein YeaO (DUF488 family)
MSIENKILYLRTKSIHAPISSDDGYRVSVMSRHTLNDGITLDPLITPKSYDLWIKDLAPPDNLVGSYYKRGLSWKDFEKQYLDFLMQPESQNKLNQLLEMVKRKTITLLCVEDKPDYCHRRLLAEECQKINPNIRINLE